MYDAHYDLLTILYFNCKTNNKYSNYQKLITDCTNIYNNNIIGGIINLYFMSKEEMLEELDIKKSELEDIVKMFDNSINYLNKLKMKKIIPSTCKFIYSIEGCDYLKDESELEILYQKGLRSILPVWNTANKFASGNRDVYGLTEEGVKLIKKAISLNMIIDLSHANEKTFDDIIKLASIERKNNKSFVLLASHSNVKSICDNSRNLSDDELIKLKNAGGYIGLITNSKFLSNNWLNETKEERQKAFIKHLRYLIDEIKYPQDKILIASDDMSFHPNSDYHNRNAFNMHNIANELYYLITTNFDDVLAKKIMITNYEDILDKINLDY